MGLEKEGCAYIKAKDELAAEAAKLLAEAAATELKGKEGEKLLQASGRRQRRQKRAWGQCSDNYSL